jgi:transposase
VHFHFTPTRASWLNQVEIWFSILEEKSLRAASFSSVDQLREHIDAFIETYNQDPSPSSRLKPKFISAASNTAVTANRDSGY